MTIKLATWDNTSKNMVTDAVAAFETANPGIKVEIIDIPSADYTTKLSVMLNGGSDVDAFFIKDGDTAKSLVEKGQLADLSAYIAADGVNLADYNGLAENFTFDGKQYALPPVQTSTSCTTTRTSLMPPTSPTPPTTGPGPTLRKPPRS